MKKISLLAAIAGVFMMTSCAHVYPGYVTTAKSVKTGEVIVKRGLFTTNLDLSVVSAAKKAGITKIATVDYGRKGKKYLIKVTGE